MWVSEPSIISNRDKKKLLSELTTQSNYQKLVLELGALEVMLTENIQKRKHYPHYSVLRKWYKFFDTSDLYGNGRSESIIGEFYSDLSQKDKDIYISTKGGCLPHRGFYMPQRLYF